MPEGNQGAPVPLISPGSATSEYKATKWVVILSALATIVGLVQAYLPALVEKLPDVKFHAIAGAVLAVAGVIAAVLKSLGYNVGRTKLKMAAMETTKEVVKMQRANAEGEAAKAKLALLAEMKNSKQLPSTAKPVESPGGATPPGSDGGP